MNKNNNGPVMSRLSVDGEPVSARFSTTMGTSAAVVAVAS
jgi:hypothetical protein